MRFARYNVTIRNGMGYGASNLLTDPQMSIYDIEDAIEDANNATELAQKLNKMNLERDNWIVERETNHRIRLSSKKPVSDRYGNVCTNAYYFIIDLAE